MKPKLTTTLLTITTLLITIDIIYNKEQALINIPTYTIMIIITLTTHYYTKKEEKK